MVSLRHAVGCVALLTSALPSTADLPASVCRGVHWSAPRVDGGHRGLRRGGEGHPLHPQSEGNMQHNNLEMPSRLNT